MTSQNLVYKTYELNTDIEHSAKPINLSGARTIKLTNIPAGVKCWISSENTGENKYPLINRGDGWVNLPSPLYDLYVFTEGTTIDNQKILLNYTGQGDFFVYGNNSSEKIDQIGQIVSLSKQAIKDLNDSIYNTYMKNVLHRFVIQGEFEYKESNLENIRLVHLPNGFNNIKSLNLNNDKFYRITQTGHFDIGNGFLEDSSGGEYDTRISNLSITSHLSIFKNTSGASYTLQKSVSSGAGLYTDMELYLLDKRPYNTSKEEFNIWGLKFRDFHIHGYTNSGWNGMLNTAYMEGGLNYNSKDFIVSGNILNNYDLFGIFWKIFNVWSPGSEAPEYKYRSTPSCHISLILEISEVLS